MNKCEIILILESLLAIMQRIKDSTDIRIDVVDLVHSMNRISDYLGEHEVEQ